MQLPLTSLCTRGNAMHNTSYRDKIHEGSKMKLNVCMHRKKYSISTYNFLTTVDEKAIKTLFLYCFNIPYLLKMSILSYSNEKTCMLTLAACIL
jgi:hypothetical protein